jgi:hypothetical protein
MRRMAEGRITNAAPGVCPLHRWHTDICHAVADEPAGKE